MTRAYFPAGLADEHDEACVTASVAGGVPGAAAGEADTWHPGRECAPEPLNPTEETPTAAMKTAIVAARMRPGVNHRPRKARMPIRAPPAPDIAINAQPAHMPQRYQRPDPISARRVASAPGFVRARTGCAGAGFSDRAGGIAEIPGELEVRDAGGFAGEPDGLSPADLLPDRCWPWRGCRLGRWW